MSTKSFPGNLFKRLYIKVKPTIATNPEIIVVYQPAVPTALNKATGLVKKTLITIDIVINIVASDGPKLPSLIKSFHPPSDLNPRPSQAPLFLHAYADLNNQA